MIQWALMRFAKKGSALLRGRMVETVRLPTVVLLASMAGLRGESGVYAASAGSLEPLVHWRTGPASLRRPLADHCA